MATNDVTDGLASELERLFARSKLAEVWLPDRVLGGPPGGLAALTALQRSRHEVQLELSYIFRLTIVRPGKWTLAVGILSVPFVGLRVEPINQGHIAVAEYADGIIMFLEQGRAPLLPHEPWQVLT